MNYIRHLSAFYVISSVDDRLNAMHISLYHALFQFWNMNRFRNPISMNRPQVLSYCKIGSNHTFYKCLNELHRWGYIDYQPSHSPSKRSYVSLCNISITQNEKDELTSAKSAQPGCKNNITDGAESTQPECKNDIGSGAKMHTLLNNTNIINNKTFKEGEKNTLNQDNFFLFSSKEKTNLDHDTDSEKKTERKKVAQKKEKEFIPPLLNEVVAFFHSEKYPEIESRKFFYHFEGNGWLVSGKTPMKNWQAAAHNWMLNTPRYETEQKLNAIKLNTRKDYGEPL